MAEVTHIKLIEHVGSSLNTRSAVRMLLSDLSNYIENEKTFSIRIDFKDIVFVSRNAIHELISLQQQLKGTNNTTVVFENMSKSVNDMYQIVSRSLPKTKQPVIIRHNISNIEDFSSVFA